MISLLNHSKNATRNHSLKHVATSVRTDLKLQLYGFYLLDDSPLIDRILGSNIRIFRYLTHA